MRTTAEPADPDRPAPETRVRVSVPEEFIAMAISEVTARDGQITDMKMTNEGAVIGATLR
jgi:translation elongation factor EF-G